MKGNLKSHCNYFVGYEQSVSLAAQFGNANQERQVHLWPPNGEKQLKLLDGDGQT
jgi:hypothetical protein